MSNVRYDAAGRLAQARYGSNIWVTHNYYGWMSADGNGNGRYAGMSAGWSPGRTDILSTAYTYDTYGNPVTSSSQRAGSPPDNGVFSYDDQNRVTNGYGESFGWETRGVMDTLNGRI